MKVPSNNESKCSCHISIKQRKFRVIVNLNIIIIGEKLHSQY